MAYQVIHKNLRLFSRNNRIELSKTFSSYLAINYNLLTSKNPRDLNRAVVNVTENNIELKKSQGFTVYKFLNKNQADLYKEYMRNPNSKEPKGILKSLV